jgi:hypothetical protein
MAYFPFTVILVPDTTTRKKTLVCMPKEANKTTQFERLQCWYYSWEGFMMYTIEMASGGMIYIPSFMKIGIGVQAILRFRLRNLRGCNVITDGRNL